MKEHTGKQNVYANLETILGSKVPPQAIEMEEAVLGTMIVDSRYVPDIARIISAKCFYKEQNARIFQAVMRLYDSEQPIEMITIINELKRTGELEAIGGPYYIGQICSPIVTGRNSETYAKIIYDKYVKRQLIKLTNEANTKSYDDQEDYYNVILEIDTQIQELISDSVIDSVEEVNSVIGNYELILEQRKENTLKGELNGLSTGLEELDSFTGGWQKGNLIIIAARPSMGKTAVALLTARTAARQGRNVLFQSLEMTKAELIQRIVLSETGIDQHRLKTGMLSEQDKYEFGDFKQQVKNWGFCIDDSSSASFSHIKMVYRKQNRKRKNKFDMLIIDYLGLMESDSDSSDNEALRLGNITKKLKQFAKKEDIPVVLLVQLNREVEKRGNNKRPILSDLKQSGSIEEDADVVTLIYRPEYYGMLIDADGHNLKGKGEIIIAKNRNGAVGSAFFKYDPEIRYITNFNSTVEFMPSITDNPF